MRVANHKKADFNLQWNNPVFCTEKHAYNEYITIVVYLIKYSSMKKKRNNKKDSCVFVFRYTVVELNVQFFRPRLWKPVQRLHKNLHTEIRIPLPMVAVTDDWKICAIDQYSNNVVFEHFMTVKALGILFIAWWICLGLIHAINFNYTSLVRILLAFLAFVPKILPLCAMLKAVLDSHFQSFAWLNNNWWK